MKILNHFKASTDNFDISCIYAAEFDIGTEYTTLTDEIGNTGSAANDDALIIGEFDLKSFSDKDYFFEINPESPINLGEHIYNKISVNNLPTGWDYIVDNCYVANIANENWIEDSELLTLFEDQICKHNDMKNVLGIDIHGKDETTLEYTFDFKSFRKVFKLMI